MIVVEGNVAPGGILKYKYDFDIIEEGLKRSTSTTNPTIKYVDAIITSWYKKGFTTVDQILESEAPSISQLFKTSHNAK